MTANLNPTTGNRPAPVPPRFLRQSDVLARIGVSLGMTLGSRRSPGESTLPPPTSGGTCSSIARASSS